MKQCIKCKEEKELEGFHKDKTRKDNRNPYCKSCRSLEEDKRTSREHKKTKLKTRYGLTLEAYEELVKSQDNKCAICSILFTANSRLSVPCVDHNHTTGKVRALLCTNCNTGIGLLQDNYMLIQKATSYIEQHNNG